jgi:hypothetical protein
VRLGATSLTGIAGRNAMGLGATQLTGLKRQAQKNPPKRVELLAFIGDVKLGFGSGLMVIISKSFVILDSFLPF